MDLWRNSRGKIFNLLVDSNIELDSAKMFNNYNNKLLIPNI